MYVHVTFGVSFTVARPGLKFVGGGIDVQPLRGVKHCGMTRITAWQREPRVRTARKVLGLFRLKGLPKRLFFFHPTNKKVEKSSREGMDVYVHTGTRERGEEEGGRLYFTNLPLISHIREEGGGK